jgi:serine/threonine-protein kinase
MNSQQLPHAEELFREALQIYSQSLPADHVNVGITHIKLGRTLLRAKRYSEAEKETHAGHDIVAKQSNPSISFLQAARHDLGEEYEALHQPEKAAQFRTAAAK